VNADYFLGGMIANFWGKGIFLKIGISKPMVTDHSYVQSQDCRGDTVSG
jgi:hypothetical protein